MESRDPNLIIQAANDKQAQDDFEGGQMIYKSALLDWVDEARELGSGSSDAETLGEAIATVWLSYANYLAEAKQFKSATDTFEQAVQCPIASRMGRVWLEYARFVEERGKRMSAQNIYIRALVGEHAVQDEQDQGLLWNEFLEMMQKSSPDLTLEELQEAVRAEHGEASEKRERPSNPISPPSMSEPTQKRIKMEENDAAQSMQPEQSAPTHSVTAKAVEVETKAFSEALATVALPPDLAAAWMVRDGHGPAHQPDISLFQASPPKLADPTAKDILGVDLALSIIERVLSPSGGVLLEACRGLWAMQALKEKKSAAAIKTLDKTLRSEVERQENGFAARISVAGENLTALQALNSNERDTLRINVSQQRINLLTGIAWEHRQMLALQQQVLTKLQVPSFEGPTLDDDALDLQVRVCSYLHSAFFLRKRVGEKPHVKMLEGHMVLLKKARERGTHSPTPPPSVAKYASPRPNHQLPPMPSPPPQYGYIQQPAMMQPSIQPYAGGQSVPPHPSQYQQGQYHQYPAHQQMPPQPQQQLQPPPPRYNNQYPPGQYY